MLVTAEVARHLPRPAVANTPQTESDQAPARRVGKVRFLLLAFPRTPRRCPPGTASQNTTT